MDCRVATLLAMTKLCRSSLNLREKLTLGNRHIYDEFSRFRDASLWNRLADLYRTGFY